MFFGIWVSADQKNQKKHRVFAIVLSAQRGGGGGGGEGERKCIVFPRVPPRILVKF